MTRHLLLVSLLVTASTLSAASRHTFSTTSTGALMGPNSGSVVFDGKRGRIEYREAIGGDNVVIVREGRRIVVNDRLKTWYERNNEDRLRLMYTVPGIESVKLSKVEVRLTAPVVIAQGWESRTLTIGYRLRGTLSGTAVGARVRAVAVIVTDPATPVETLPLEPRAIRTGHESVDGEIERLMSSVKGFPREVSVTVQRQIDGGAMFEQVDTTTFSALETIEGQGQLFEIPAGYEYREPVIMGPATP